jgi:hypothetical protein
MRAAHFDFSRVAQLAGAAGVVHVRFAGQSFDVPLARLDVSGQSEDYWIKRALAAYLCLPEGALEKYVIDRHAGGNLTVRPAAILQ